MLVSLCSKINGRMSRSHISTAQGRLSQVQPLNDDVSVGGGRSHDTPRLPTATSEQRASTTSSKQVRVRIQTRSDEQEVGYIRTNSANSCVPSPADSHNGDDQGVKGAQEIPLAVSVRHDSASPSNEVKEDDISDEEDRDKRRRTKRDKLPKLARTAFSNFESAKRLRNIRKGKRHRKYDRPAFWALLKRIFIGESDEPGHEFSLDTLKEVQERANNLQKMDQRTWHDGPSFWSRASSDEKLDYGRQRDWLKHNPTTCGCRPWLLEPYCEESNDSYPDQDSRDARLARAQSRNAMYAAPRRKLGTPKTTSKLNLPMQVKSCR